jgi:hypothetical protein
MIFGLGVAPAADRPGLHSPDDVQFCRINAPRKI